MTPKEKANELVKKHYDSFPIDGNSLAIKSALITVNEIINTLDSFGYIGAMYDDFETGRLVTTDEILPETYWIEVRNELNKL